MLFADSILQQSAGLITILIVALIAVVIIVAVALLGNNLLGIFNKAASSVK